MLSRTRSSDNILAHSRHFVSVYLLCQGLLYISWGICRLHHYFSFTLWWRLAIARSLQRLWKLESRRMQNISAERGVFSGTVKSPPWLELQGTSPKSLSFAREMKGISQLSSLNGRAIRQFIEKGNLSETQAGRKTQRLLDSLDKQRWCSE